MVGVRLFNGIGFFLSIVIFLLLIKLKPEHVDKRFCFLCTFACGLFQLLKGALPLYALNITLQILNSLLLCFYYQKHNFWQDFKSVLKFIMIHATISVFVDLLMPRSLMQYYNVFGTEKYSFMYFFHVAESAPTPIPGIHRLQGIAWESGCLQLFLNIYLFVLLQEPKLRMMYIITTVFLIIATYSTSGFLVMFVNFLIYIRTRARKHFATVIFVSSLIMILLVPFMWDNIVAKMTMEEGKIDLSGVVRYRDFMTGVLCLIRYPLFGIDMTEPATNPIYCNLESEAFELLGYPSYVMDSLEVGAGGYTNGILSMSMMWGVMGLYLIYSFVKCRLWYDLAGKYWYLIPCIFLMSLISEPISNTAFFWFFCLFNIITNRMNKYKTAVIKI